MTSFDEKLRSVGLSLPLRRMRCASRHAFAFHGMDFGRGVARRGARPTARATKAQRGIRPGRRAMNCGTLKGLCRDAFYRLLRRAYANEVWAHVELAAVEENGGAEVLKAAVALGGGLERLYRRVEPFREGVVDAAVEPRQKAVEVILQRVGDLDHVLEAGLDDLLVPEREVGLGHELVTALPEPPEQFLEPPCLPGVERTLQQVVSVCYGLVAHVLEFRQPEVLALGESRVSGRHEQLGLVLARIVHAIVEMRLDVVLVEHHVGARHELAHRVLERGGHVHRHAAHHVLLKRAQGLLYQSGCAFLAPATRDVQHPSVVDVGHDAGERLRILPPEKALLVHADERDFLGVTPRKTPLHGCGHDVVRLKPAQPQQVPCVLDAPGGLEVVYCERLEKQRKARPFLGPGKLDDLDLVVRTFHARRLCMNKRLELHRVEMPPCPLWLLVVKRHQPSAYRADRGALRILQPDVDAAGGHIKLHVGDVPLLAKSKERGIVLVENVFHADIIPHLQGGCVARSREAVARTPTVGVSNCTFQAALSTKNSEEPFSYLFDKNV